MIKNSIRSRLKAAFIALAIGPLLLLGVVLTYQSYIIQREQAIQLQREVSERVSDQIMNYFHNIENELKLVISVNVIVKDDHTQQCKTLCRIRSYKNEWHKDVFNELVLLDSSGRERGRVSRVKVYTDNDLGERSQSDEFLIPVTTGKIYYSPVSFDKEIGEPFITMGMPITDTRSGLVKGVLVAEIRLRDIWNLIANLHIGAAGNAYIVDRDGMVIAHKNHSLVLKGTHFQVPDHAGVYTGLLGTKDVIASKRISLGNQTLNIVTSRPLPEALSLTIRIVLIISVLVVIAMAGAVTLGLLVKRKIIQPIELLADTAQAISSGNLSRQAEISSSDEIGTLANAFNAMSAELVAMIDSLKQHVAELDEAEKSLIKERDLFKVLIDSLPGVFYLFTDKGKLLQWNKNAEEVLGYSPEEIVDHSATDFFVERDKGLVTERIGEVFIKGNSSVEAHFLTKDRREIPYLLTGFRCEIDNVPCLIGLGLDISDRKMAEEALRQSHERLISVFDSLDAGVYVADLETYELLFVNKHARDMFGDIVGKICWQVFQANQTGPCSFCTNDKLLTPDGQSTGVYVWEFNNTVNGRWYELRDRAIRWVDGRFVRLEIATDITERKQADKVLYETMIKLEDEKAKSQAIIAAIGDGISIQATDFMVLYQNQIHKDSIGEHIGEYCYMAYEERNHVCEGCPVDQSFKDGNIHAAERTIITDKGLRHFEITASPLKDSTGKIIAGIEVVRDITERKKHEAELLRASNLESIGRLATGIAHEINNPLTNVSLNLQILKNRLQNSITDANTLQKLEAIERNIDRASIIAKELLLFSRQRESESIPLNINNIIRGVLVLMKYKLKEVAIHQNLPEIPVILGDPVKLEQVFINILNNSVEAMPHGGDIFISTSHINNYIEVKISDTGVGISDDHISKVFDPFFTTKEVGAGTGLGLSICYGIINQHSGTIEVSSKVGKGTTVIIKLPIMENNEKDSYSR